jgi:D-beta-D-heptose 7-phosphate kinase/D-beta-D-heptose 1-phosphate adenosyltransferase
VKGLVIQWETARLLCGDLRRAGRTIAFTNGCFDIIHGGHMYTLGRAAREADVLFVGLNSDESVTRIKGPARPIIREKSRAAVLCGIRGVDFVVVFDEDTPADLIAQILPDVLVKSEEYEESEIVGADVVKARGGRVLRVPVQPSISTSGIVKKIREGEE